MRDPRFRQQQLDALRAPHVAPVNALVDELIDPAGRGWVPYVAPLYGGVHARVLNIFRDPGPKTHARTGGSGFLCTENDDASAERFALLLDGAGIPVSETLSWNAYPWYVNRLPRAHELDDGVEPLRRLLRLLPGLRVVMLHGGSAQDGWRRLARQDPGAACRLAVVATYHTSSQAFIGPPPVRAARRAALTEAFAQTAGILREAGQAPVADFRNADRPGRRWSGGRGREQAGSVTRRSGGSAAAQLGQHALAEPVRLLQVRVAGEDELLDARARRTPRSGRRPRWWLPTSAVPAPPRTRPTPAHRFG